MPVATVSSFRFLRDRDSIIKSTIVPNPKLKSRQNYGTKPPFWGYCGASRAWHGAPEARSWHHQSLRHAARVS
jgi:hypothetical protein